MKYLYFDCFAGFTPAMAAGALLDMTSDEETIKKIIRSKKGVHFLRSDVKRCAMEAVMFGIDVTDCGKVLKKDELIADCDGFDISDGAKQQLAEFVAKKAEARAINPDDAQFSYDDELPSLVAAAYVFEKIAHLKAEKVTVSSVLYSDATNFSGTQFSPVTRSETMYICKKHSIPLTPSPITSELICEGGAALLGVLGAAFAASPAGNIIKIGYGAGKEDFADIPNLVRTVYGEEDEDAMLFEAKSAFEDVFAEFAAMENMV